MTINPLMNSPHSRGTSGRLISKESSTGSLDVLCSGREDHHRCLTFRFTCLVGGCCREEELGSGMNSGGGGGGGSGVCDGVDGGCATCFSAGSSAGRGTSDNTGCCCFQGFFGDGVCQSAAPFIHFKAVERSVGKKRVVIKQARGR